MQPRISLLTLGVEDIARSRTFYAALGFVASGPSGGDVAFFMAGGVVLSLYSRASLLRDTGLADGVPGFSGITIAHNVRTQSEVAAVLGEAMAAGGRLVKASHKVFWGGTIGYFADPDGHLWEVAYNPDFPFDAEGNLQLPAAKQ
jgi:catechol 2,3-dioxygenase-like lactoylglutathione lyase family enzyme